jgi:hypothetical protein
MSKKELILKEKAAAGQHRDFSDKAGPVMVQMTADECKSQCKEAGVEYKKGYESRVLRYTCSDDSVDRMGDVIKQDGWNLESFKKNPVIMGFHDYSTFPVGNALSVGVDGNKLKMNILFADGEVNEDADKAFRMAKSGFMRAGSVGFNPKKYHMATPDEQKDLGMGQYGMMFEEQELMEFSVCGVPANANALQESISKGMFRKSELKGFVKDELLKEVKDFTPELEGTLTDFSKGGFPNVGDGLTMIKVNPEDLAKDGDRVDLTKIVKEILAQQQSEQKAGAVLSKKNKDSINKAVDGMEAAITALKSLLTNAESSKEENDDEPDTDKSAEDTLTIDIDLDDVDDSEEDGALYSEDNILEIEL